jgi:HemY protein
MLRLVVYFLVVAGLAAILSWLADNPGSIVVNWQGYIWDTNVFQMAIILSVLAALIIVLWTALRSIWQSPAAIGNFFNRRREKRGLEALSSGMIAIGAGDRSLATRYAIQARKSLPNEPMTHLLRAQAAQLAGDRATSRRIFEAMLASPDTEALGLRGLFLEAEREGEKEAARQFCERAVRLNPKLSWPVDALFEIQCKSGDWDGALETLTVAKKHGHIEKQSADRRRAVLLAGQAQDAEDTDPERAMNLALEAHSLASDLVPAAAVAGRLLAARGNTPRATKVLQKTWRKSPHPDLAVAYAYARLGDSPRDRLQRVKELAAATPNVIESPIAIANAAIEARDFDAARAALAPLQEGRLTQRVCTLMARIEGEQSGNAGAVREWLARAVNAPRDPVWTADGIVSDTWQPVSPVTGALDAFQWRVPVEAAQPHSKEILAQKIEELVKLGVGPEAMLGGADLEASVGDADPVAADRARPVNSKPPVDDRTLDAEAVEIKPAGTAQKQKSESAGRDDDTRPPGAGRPGADAASSGNEAGPSAAPTATATAPAGKSETGAATSVADSKPPASDRKQETPASRSAAAAGRTTAVEGDQAAGKAVPPRTSAPPATAEDRAANAAAGGSGGSGGTQTAAAARSAPATKPLPIEPKIFVPPRAPDDPGLDESEKDNKRSSLLPFQPAKG